MTPGVPGDSGSAFLSADGKAIGVLSTLGLAPLPLSNNIGDLAKELDLRPGPLGSRRADSGPRHGAVQPDPLTNRQGAAVRSPESRGRTTWPGPRHGAHAPGEHGVRVSPVRSGALRDRYVIVLGRSRRLRSKRDHPTKPLAVGAARRSSRFRGDPGKT